MPIPKIEAPSPARQIQLRSRLIADRLRQSKGVDMILGELRALGTPTTAEEIENVRQDPMLQQVGPKQEYADPMQIAQAILGNKEASDKDRLAAAKFIRDEENSRENLERQAGYFTPKEVKELLGAMQQSKEQRCPVGATA